MRKLSSLGIYNYSSIMTYVAQLYGYDNLANFEYPNRVEKTMIYQSRKSFDINYLIELPNKSLKEKRFNNTGYLCLRKFAKPVNLLYGQPIVSEKRGLTTVFDNIFNVVKPHKPDTYLFIVPARKPKVIKKYFSELKDGYRWTIVRLSSLGVGVPIHSAYYIIIGSYWGFSPKIKHTNSNVLPTVQGAFGLNKSLLKKLKIKKKLKKATGLYTAWDTLESLPELNSDLVTGHELFKGEGLQSRMMWECSELLTEGQAMYLLPKSEYPPSAKNFHGKLMNVQMPIRLSRELPTQSISTMPKFIHPTENRPISVREIARLLCLPDQEVKINIKWVNAIRYLSNVIPPPVCQYAFDLVKNVEQEITSDNPIFTDASIHTDKLFHNKKDTFVNKSL